ncbi:hypothetical protein V1523DRAFT_418440 [Lipomyces doorenjongii]
MSAGSIARGVFSVLSGKLFVTLPVPNTDLRGQTYIVSGSNTGLGFEATRHLSRLGAEKLIMAVRSIAKGEAAKREILKSTGRNESSIEVWELDMDSYDSVKTFAARVTDTLPRVDGVLANAGLLRDVFEVSEDNEQTITVNVVSTFLLFLLLLPKLRESAKQFNTHPRFTTVNSALHYMAPLKELEREDGRIFDRLNDPKTSDMAARYPISKLLTLYAVRDFAERLKASSKGSTVVINSANPSFCKSGLLNSTKDAGSLGTKLQKKALARSTEEGSRALVHGVTAGPETNGHYLNNCHIQTPSSSVTSAKGVHIQKRFSKELFAKLVKIAPEVSSYL